MLCLFGVNTTMVCYGTGLPSSVSINFLAMVKSPWELTMCKTLVPFFHQDCWLRSRHHFYLEMCTVYFNLNFWLLLLPKGEC